MSAGPRVFGSNRRGIWVASNANLTDKLKHVMPRLRGAINNITDVFLPPEATLDHKRIVRANDFFSHIYAVAHDKTPVDLAKFALARRKINGAGAIDFDIEGSAITDDGMAAYIKALVAQVRKTNPKLPIRINVVPYKGQFLKPLAPLFADDDNLHLIAQAYGGNMDTLFPADEVKQNLLAYGMPEEKVSIMHAIMCAPRPGMKREIVLPAVRDKGDFYIDDLLLDAGLL